MSLRPRLHCGTAAPVELSLAEAAWVGPSPASQQEPSAVDLPTAVRAALQQPLGFPDIAQALVPGDRVALALGEGVCHAAEVVQATVAVLEQAGVERESIVVVAGNQDDAERLSAQLTELIATGCEVVGHDGQDEANLCYVAAVDEQPLLMNRQLFEADFVLPIGCARLVESRDYCGPYEAIFPRFADHKTQLRYQQADAADAVLDSATRYHETEQAGWLLGASLVMQVLPGIGGEVAGVIAGELEEVAPIVEQRCAELWHCPVSQRAELVVASLTGGPGEQTWANVARALYAAGRVADEEQGAVAICTELEQPPGEALQKLIATSGDLEHAAQLGGEQSRDAAAAWEIYKARCRGPVYLLSRLEEELVEELGLIPVANCEELARLASRSKSCLVLDSAQHAVPSLTPSETEETS